MTLGEIIINYRNEHGISMREFARKCGLSNSYVSMLERGFDGRGKPIVPSIETIDAVAKGCGDSFENIFNKLDHNQSLTINNDYTEEEKSFIIEYRNTDEETKAMIKRLLAYNDAFNKKGE